MHGSDWCMGSEMVTAELFSGHELVQIWLGPHLEYSKYTLAPSRTHLTCIFYTK